MNISPATAPTIGVGVSPFETFQIASSDFQDAQKALTFPSNVRVNVLDSLNVAKTFASHAVQVLGPLADGSRSVGRPAAAAIANAAHGVELLGDAAKAYMVSSGTTAHGLDVSALIEAARASFGAADANLWEETAG